MVWEHRDLSQKDMNSLFLKIKSPDAQTNNNKWVVGSPDAGRPHFPEKEEVLESYTRPEAQAAGSLLYKAWHIVGMLCVCFSAVLAGDIW